MSKHEMYETKAEQMLKPICDSHNVEIYDVEYVNEAGEWYLRAYIDKEDGVTINDCEAVSRAFSDALDADDFIEEAYYLEVSSPGLGRTLKKDRHFEKSIGMEVELKTYKPINKKKEFSGILVAFDKENLTVEIEEREVVFKRSDLASVKLAFEY